MATSSIEWTEATWNPVTGCTRVSAGCDNCYAVTMTRRLAAMGQDKYDGLIKPGKGHFNGVVRCVPGALPVPLQRRVPTLWFVNSMSDLFHKDVPDSFIDRVFAVMALCRWHTFQILTKRPERMAAYFNEAFQPDAEGRTDTRQGRVREALFDLLGELDLPDDHPLLDHAFDEEGEFRMKSAWPLPNVWLGTSVEDQAAADERIPHLLRVPAAVRFLSCEPLLSDVELSPAWLSCDTDGPCTICDEIECDCGKVDWVIVGGESGPKARPFHLTWARALVEQCGAAGVPVFVKQLGSVPVMDEAEWAAMHPTPLLRYGNAKMAPAGTVPLLLQSGKGGDMSQWPGDLRVRQMPMAGVLR